MLPVCSSAFPLALALTLTVVPALAAESVPVDETLRDRALAVLRDGLVATEAGTRVRAARALLWHSHEVERARAVLEREGASDDVADGAEIAPPEQPGDAGEREAALAGAVASLEAVGEPAERIAAVELLGEIGEATHVALLSPFLDDDDDNDDNDNAVDAVDADLRVAAAHAILRIGRRAPHRLSALDWAVIALYGAGLLGVGWYFSRRTTTREEYLLGGRRMRSTAVGLSLFASLMSTISYLAWPGEMLLHGPIYLGLVLGYPLAFLFTGWLIIPTIMKLRVTSAYEILDARLGPTVRTVGSSFFLCLRLIWMSVIIYATTTKVLIPVLGLEASATPLVCVLLGAITIVYTTMGGFRAVVVTDVVQTLILFGGAVLTVVVVSVELGGVGAWWPEGWASHWPEPIYGYDTQARMTLLGMATAAFTWHICTSASDQIAIQRYLATRDARSARRVLATSLTTDACVALFLGCLGLALLAYFQRQPHMVPDGPGLFSSDDMADKLFPQFIVFGLPIGISGLVISGLLAAAMSSLSSGVNSSCSVIAVDFIDRFRERQIGEMARVRLAKVISVAVGVIVVLLGTAVGIVEGNLLEVTYKTVNLLTAPLAGLFFMAIFVRRASQTGTLIGSACCVAVVVLINYWEQILGSKGPSFLWAMPLGLLTQIVVGTIASFVFPRRGPLPAEE